MRKLLRVLITATMVASLIGAHHSIRSATKLVLRIVARLIGLLLLLHAHRALAVSAFYFSAVLLIAVHPARAQAPGTAAIETPAERESREGYVHSDQGLRDYGKFVDTRQFAHHYSFEDRNGLSSRPVDIYTNGGEDLAWVEAIYHATFRAAAVFLLRSYGWQIRAYPTQKHVTFKFLTWQQLNSRANFSNAADCAQEVYACFGGLTFFSERNPEITTYVAPSPFSAFPNDEASMLAHEILHQILYARGTAPGSLGLHYELSDKREHQIISAFLRWWHEQPGCPLRARKKSQSAIARQ